MQIFEKELQNSKSMKDLVIVYVCVLHVVRAHGMCSAHTGMDTEATGGRLVFSSITLHLIPLTQESHTEEKACLLARLAGQ